MKLSGRLASLRSGQERHDQARAVRYDGPKQVEAENRKNSYLTVKEGSRLLPEPLLKLYESKNPSRELDVLGRVPSAEVEVGVPVPLPRSVRNQAAGRVLEAGVAE